MATPEALIKYYDGLRDSFNKMQVKNNEVYLVNAALRPKIREEFAKSKDLLVSYLNYLKVFVLIYSDKFPTICISIICPLFKEHPFKRSLSQTVAGANQANATSDEDIPHLIHETIRVIFKSKPELIDDFIHCIIKAFPFTNSDDQTTFTSYLSNALEICTYVRGESLVNLIARILDRVSPPTSQESKISEITTTLDASYDLIYELIDSSEGKQLDNVSAAILAAFSREFLTSDNDEAMNHLVLYLCSKDEKLVDVFLNLLWANFTDSERSFDERRTSVLYAASFMSRANYVTLDKVLIHLETAALWCKSFITNENMCETSDVPEQSERLFYPLVESMLYIITQRYREMYEEASITRLKKLDLDSIIVSSYKPLEACDSQTVVRFREVSTLYGISSQFGYPAPQNKRRTSTNNQPHQLQEWKIPFRESCDSLPPRISKLYRNYYNHRNFTIYRD